MSDKIYYLFLDGHQWDALKSICESYFRESKGSGFQQMAADKVEKARFFQELNIQWERWEEWENNTETSINQPEWAYKWAMRDLLSLENNIRTLMAKFLGLKLKYETSQKIIDTEDFESMRRRIKNQKENIDKLLKLRVADSVLIKAYKTKSALRVNFNYEDLTSSKPDLDYFHDILGTWRLH